MTEGQRIIRRHFLWGGVLLVGAILGVGIRGGQRSEQVLVSGQDVVSEFDREIMTGFHIFAAGFLVGAVPGAVLLIRNMLRAHWLQKRVEQVAFEERKFADPIFGLSSSISRQREFLVRPDSLLMADDSSRLRLAKEELISTRSNILRCHQKSALVMFVGAAVGALLGYYAATYFGFGF